MFAPDAYILLPAYCHCNILDISGRAISNKMLSYRKETALQGAL